MKQKSDAKKRQEGRCLGTGNLYVGFIKANEIGSIGASTAIYDPIAERTVDTLSMGEKEFSGSCVFAMTWHRFRNR